MCPTWTLLSSWCLVLRRWSWKILWETLNTERKKTTLKLQIQTETAEIGSHLKLSDWFKGYSLDWIFKSDQSAEKKYQQLQVCVRGFEGKCVEYKIFLNIYCSHKLMNGCGFKANKKERHFSWLNIKPNSILYISVSLCLRLVSNRCSVPDTATTLGSVWRQSWRPRCSCCHRLLPLPVSAQQKQDLEIKQRRRRKNPESVSVFYPSVNLSWRCKRTLILLVVAVAEVSLCWFWSFSLLSFGVDFLKFIKQKRNC